jgi:hypothetical protein
MGWAKLLTVSLLTKAQVLVSWAQADALVAEPAIGGLSRGGAVNIMMLGDTHDNKASTI